MKNTVMKGPVCVPQDESDVESLVTGLPQDLLLLFLSRGQEVMKEREIVQSCHDVDCFREDWMGNMKDFEVSGDILPGSISFSNKGFEEPLFPAKTVFLVLPFPWCVALDAGQQQHLVSRTFTRMRSPRRSC